MADFVNSVNSNSEFNFKKIKILGRREYNERVSGSIKRDNINGSTGLLDLRNLIQTLSDRKAIGIQNRRKNENAKVNKNPKPDSSSFKKLFVNKYEPKIFFDLISDDSANRKVLEWLKSETKNGEPKMILLHGPPGSGKTSSAHVISRHCGFTPIETNASSQRSVGSLISDIKTICSINAISFGENGKRDKSLLIIDEIDGIGKNERELKTLIQFLSNNKNVFKTPIICICNDLYARPLKVLRENLKIVKFPAVSENSLYLCLESICKNEEINIDSSVLKKLSKISDIRNSLHTLQFLAGNQNPNEKLTLEHYNKFGPSHKDVKNDIFSALRNIFEGDFSAVLKETALNIQRHFLLSSIFENYLELSSYYYLNDIVMAAEEISETNLNENNVYSCLRRISKNNLRGIKNRVKLPKGMAKTNSQKTAFDLILKTYKHKHNLKYTSSIQPLLLYTIPVLLEALSYAIKHQNQYAIKVILNEVTMNGFTLEKRDTKISLKPDLEVFSLSPPLDIPKWLFSHCSSRNKSENINSKLNKINEEKGGNRKRQRSESVKSNNIFESKNLGNFGNFGNFWNLGRKRSKQKSERGNKRNCVRYVYKEGCTSAVKKNAKINEFLL